MTDCYCDYDPPKFYVSTMPRARKEHTCDECGHKIQPKEIYERATGMWDGSPDTFVTCERCVTLRQWVKNSVPCFCWAHGNMIEDAEETIKDAWWRARDEVSGIWFGFLRRKYAVQRGREK